MGRKITADYVRDKFPVCVEFADECRDVFGSGVKMVYAREGGQVIGKQFAGDDQVCMADVDMTPMQNPDQIRRGWRGAK